MGYEWQAKVFPGLAPSELLNALKTKFASLGYQIVRPEAHGFGGAFAVQDSDWNEDFFVGVGANLEEAANGTAAQNSAAEPKTIIYLLFHLYANLARDTVTAQINETVQQFGNEIVWEEL